MEMVRQRRFLAGVSQDDIAQLEEALTGLRYPVEKWQLIAHAVRTLAGRTGPEMRTIQQLWALPAGRYRSFPQVLAGAARTARGHPRRA